MTITLFITILTGGAAASGLLTEAIKKAYTNANRNYSANVIALINAAIVGGGGTAVTYMLIGIPWSTNNLICVVLMVICVWIGSMVGYDKIMQLIKQITDSSTMGDNG